MSEKNLNFTQKLYGDGQFRYSIEQQKLPEGFVRYHKANFQRYFGLDEAGFRGRKTLDTGCGPGKHAAVLALMGADVLALDLTPANLDKGRAIKDAYGLTNLEFRRHNLMEPVGQDDFELVSAHNWMQHAENPSAVMHNLARSMRMGGRLYLSLYHARTFRFFVAWIARTLLTQDHYDLMRGLVRFTYPQGFKVFGNPDDIYMENIFDDFFVPYCHATTYDIVVRDGARLGLRPITEVPDDTGYEGLDNIPLRIGFEKVEPTPDSVELEYNHPVDEFQHRVPELGRSVALAKELIAQLRERNDPVRTCAFCLGLYRLRAELNAVRDVNAHHEPLCGYLESCLDDSLRRISYFYDSASLYDGADLSAAKDAKGNK